MKNEKRVGLALSGGGYRAAAFHLGTLRKLYQLNILDKVDVLSTISGGSITGAAYLIKQWNYPAFEKQMINTLTTKSVVRYVISSFLFIDHFGSGNHAVSIQDISC
jgi:NTE family protein